MRVHLITPVITEGIRTLDDVAPLMRDDLVITQSLLATGPASIECEFDEAMAVPGLVVEAIRAERAGADAIVIDCMGDPGLKAAREVVSIPVLGPAQTAMHLAAIGELDARLIPEIAALAETIEAKAEAWMDVPKIGRTHLQDAVPLSVGQEWCAWAEALRSACADIEHAREGLLEIALGGTAVGTGLNAPEGFSEDVAREIARLTRLPIRTAPNKFYAQATIDPIVRLSAALRGLAVVLIKIANDVRWLASGPRCGIGELKLPANEPGSSIMPGKVNPTQCEALMMVAMQVIGHDTTNAMAGSWGNLQLNAMRPVVAANIVNSIRILADGSASFRENAIEGITLDRERLAKLLEESLMLVTALVPEIGYMDAAHIAEAAAANGTTLREEAIASGKIGAEDYDRIVQPSGMTGKGLSGA